MDGVLIDSEPFWRESEIEVFGRNGLHLSEADCILTTGMRIGEVTRYWYERRPWNGPAPEILAGEILRGVIRRVNERGTAMPGLPDAIRLFRSHGLRLALASSSALSLIDAVIDRLELRPHFEVICSAENEPRGKPHPDVYLSAAGRARPRARAVPGGGRFDRRRAGRQGRRDEMHRHPPARTAPPTPATARLT